MSPMPFVVVGFYSLGLGLELKWWGICTLLTLRTIELPINQSFKYIVLILIGILILYTDDGAALRELKIIAFDEERL